MIYASQIIIPRSKLIPDRERFFYLGAEEADQLDRYLANHDWWVYVRQRGPNPCRYVALPYHLFPHLKFTGVEIVRISEFDRRMCSSGGGIPSVQTTLIDK